MSSALRIALALLGISLFGLAVSGQSIYARLSYLWFFLIVGNYILSRLALKGIELKRTARVHRAQVGEIFEEVFEIHNNSRVPHLWLELRDEGSLPGARSSRVLSLIGPRRTRSYASRTRLIARGVYALGPTQISSGDIFGFFSVTRRIPIENFLTVYPQVVALQALPHLPGLLPGGEAVRRRTHQITTNAATVREYAHGDPLSRIHWASTARRDRLIVKEFELDPLAEVWIFVDAERKSHAQLGHTLESDPGSVILQPLGEMRLLPSTEEYSATIAASLGQHYLQAGRSVGLISAARTLDVLAADRGARQLGKIMETLALMRADGEVPFASLMMDYARFLTRGSTVILVTPTTDRNLLVLVDHVQRLGLRPVVVLLDSASFGGRKGTRQLSETLAGLGVPQVRIAEGDPLAPALQQLSNPSRATLVN